MATYSGFGNQESEMEYYKSLFNLLKVCTDYIYTKKTGGTVYEELWDTSFSKIYRKLYNLEMKKFLPPRFTPASKQLAKLLRISKSGSLRRSASPKNRQSEKQVKSFQFETVKEKRDLTPQPILTVHTTTRIHKPTMKAYNGMFRSMIQRSFRKKIQPLPDRAKNLLADRTQLGTRSASRNRNRVREIQTQDGPITHFYSPLGPSKY